MSCFLMAVDVSDTVTISKCRRISSMTCTREGSHDKLLHVTGRAGNLAPIRFDELRLITQQVIYGTRDPKYTYTYGRKWLCAQSNNAFIGVFDPSVRGISSTEPKYVTKGRGGRGSLLPPFPSPRPNPASRIFLKRFEPTPDDGFSRCEGHNTRKKDLETRRREGGKKRTREKKKKKLRTSPEGPRKNLCFDMAPSTSQHVSTACFRILWTGSEKYWITTSLLSPLGHVRIANADKLLV